MQFLADRLKMYFALLKPGMILFCQAIYDFVILGFHDDVSRNEVDCVAEPVHPLKYVKVSMYVSI